jgi:hypothetical protein
MEDARAFPSIVGNHELTKNINISDKNPESSVTLLDTQIRPGQRN